MRYFDRNDLIACLKWAWRNEIDVLEREFAAYVGTRYAIGTSFGRNALYLGLRAVDVHEQEVILPAFICTVVRHAIVMAGAIPRFVDVDPDTFEYDLEDLKRNVTPRTKAMLLVHYFGRAAQNTREVSDFARLNNLMLIEDCAHSLGAVYEGRKVGTFGDFSIFSLTKNMINFGGGFLVTDDETLHAKARGVLSEEQRGMTECVKNFTVALSCGAEQMIYKLMFDRVGTSKHVWFLGLPRLLLTTGNYLCAFFELPRRFFRRRSEKTAYAQSVSMPSVVASLGRTQLMKIDRLIERRRKICKELDQGMHVHFRRANAEDTGDVCTHVILRFSDSDIFKVIDRCRNVGLSLVATWPTRQKKWRHLESAKLARIEREILIWNVNPDLTNGEIEQFLSIVDETDFHEARSQSSSAARSLSP